jgi:hypothetical protein
MAHEASNPWVTLEDSVNVVEIIEPLEVLENELQTGIGGIEGSMIGSF